MRPRLLDLFCGAGGCAKGYQRAGFHVVGVDNHPQPRYCGDEFVHADALDVLPDLLAGGTVAGHRLEDFAAIHASPPCQRYTDYRRRGDGVGDGYADLIAETRHLLEASDLPYVIENVAGAPLRGAVMLCGTAFDLDVRRHRYFESNVSVMSPGCAHGRHAARFPGATNRGQGSRRTVEVGVWRIPLEVQRHAMGIDWMTREELSQAIPPAYTEHIGHFLMLEVNARPSRHAERTA